MAAAAAAAAATARLGRRPSRPQVLAAVPEVGASGAAVRLERLQGHAHATSRTCAYLGAVVRLERLAQVGRGSGRNLVCPEGDGGLGGAAPRAREHRGVGGAEREGALARDGRAAEAEA